MSNYATRSDIEARYSQQNVNAWADLSNTQVASEITARITWALTTATDRINDLLRGGAYKVPLELVSGVYPSIIVDCTAHLAAIFLYELRGEQELDNKGRPAHRLIGKKTEILELLSNLRMGSIRLDSDSYPMQITVIPQIVED